VGEEQEATRMEEGTKEELEEKSNILHPKKMENDSKTSPNVILEGGEEQEAKRMEEGTKEVLEEKSNILT
jgi:hypothetical protein